MTELVPLPGAPSSATVPRRAPRGSLPLRSAELLMLGLVLVDVCAVALIVLFLVRQPAILQRVELLPLLARMPETGASLQTNPAFTDTPVPSTATPTIQVPSQSQEGWMPSATPLQPTPTHDQATAAEALMPEPTPTPTELAVTVTPPPPTPAPTQSPPTPTQAPVLDSVPATSPSLPTFQSSSARTPANAPPTRIRIPSIGVDVPVQSVGPVTVVRNGQEKLIWDTRPDVACFHETSALPGRPGNTVINGHRDVGAAVFRMLDKVQIGDEIDVFVDDAAYVYHVTEVLVVPHTFASPEQRAENQRLIGFIPEERLTLITCTPIGSTTHRLLVIAKPLAEG